MPACSVRTVTHAVLLLGIARGVVGSDVTAAASQTTRPWHLAADVSLLSDNYEDNRVLYGLSVSKRRDRGIEYGGELASTFRDLDQSGSNRDTVERQTVSARRT